MCERGPFRSPRHDLGSVGAQRGERARRELAAAPGRLAPSWQTRSRDEIAGEPPRFRVAAEEFKPSPATSQ